MQRIRKEKSNDFYNVLRIEAKIVVEKVQNGHFGDKSLEESLKAAPEGTAFSV